LYDDEVCAVKNCQLFSLIVFRSSTTSKSLTTWSSERKCRYGYGA